MRPYSSRPTRALRTLPVRGRVYRPGLDGPRKGEWPDWLVFTLCALLVAGSLLWGLLR